MEEAELAEDEPVTDEELEESEEAEEDEEDEEPELCGHPVGNGECILPAGHEGSHRLHPEE